MLFESLYCRNSTLVCVHVCALCGLHLCLFADVIFEFQGKIQEAKFCLIRQDTHTPGYVISFLYGTADVKSLTKLHAAMTLITANATEPKPQWNTHTHKYRSRIITLGEGAD